MRKEPNAATGGDNPGKRHEVLSALARQLTYCRDELQKQGLQSASSLTDLAVLTVAETLARENDSSESRPISA
jgi:hypothetical protein